MPIHITFVVISSQNDIPFNENGKTNLNTDILYGRFHLHQRACFNHVGGRKSRKRYILAGSAKQVSKSGDVIVMNKYKIASTI